MLKAPFSTPVLLSPPQKNPASISIDDITNDPSTKPSQNYINHIPPAAFRDNNTLSRTAASPSTYYTTSLITPRLDTIHSLLWLAGLPSLARPLHRQLLLGRQISITEEADEHLLWHEARIFIKPFPTFLFDLDCWKRELCQSKEVHEAACGFVLSYAWIVRHESDLRVAHELGLLPEKVDWGMWIEFIDDFLQHVDLQSLSNVSPRFQYGELRLSRLNKIYRLTQYSWRDFVRGYMTPSTWYGDFFARNFGWMLAIFAFMSVVLSAMQVVLTVPRGGHAFEDTSYGFSVASLFLIAVTTTIVLVIWSFLFLYYLVSAQMNNRQVLGERHRFADVKKDVAC